MQPNDDVEHPLQAQSDLVGEVPQNAPTDLSGHGGILKAFGGTVYQRVGQFFGLTDQELGALHHQLNQYRQQEVQFQQHIDKLQAEKEQQRAFINRLKKQNEAYHQDHQRLKNANDELQSECTELRNHIFTVGTGRAPLQTDKYYLSKFEQLKGAIEQEMVELSEQCTDYDLSETAQEKALEQIAQLGPHGVKSCARLLSPKSSIAVLYRKDELRNSLLRHVAALFLLDKVFEPFAFGISSELSNGLKTIEMDHFEHGPSFY
jgi:predicted nuclease with TOPRIM domain